MFEIHGWVVIREAFNESGESDDALSFAISKIQRELDKMDFGSFSGQLTNQNGAHNLTLSGLFNRPASRWEAIKALLATIVKVAPGSYGLVHFFDDEVSGNDAGLFKVYVIKKGNIELFTEKNLSPYFTEVEDR
jgi:hypothetical protein